MAKGTKSIEKYSLNSFVDAIGLFCPLPIIMLKKALDKLGPGEKVEIWADDPAFPEDISSWCQETKNKLLLLTSPDGKNFKAVVEKYEKN